MTATKKSAAKKAASTTKPKAAKSPEDAAKAAAAAANKSAGSDEAEGRPVEAEMNRPDAESEGLSAAAKLAIKRAEQNRAQEEEDLDRADETITLKQSEIMVTRDNSRSTIRVFAYEAPVYEAIHGVENIDEIGERDVEVLDWSPDSAYDTMLRKFGKNGEKKVRAVYQNEAQLAREAGVRYKPTSASKKRDRAGQGAMIVDYSKPDTVKEISRQRVARVVTK